MDAQSPHDYDTHLYWMVRYRGKPAFEYIWSRWAIGGVHAHYTIGSNVLMPLEAPGSKHMRDHADAYDIIRLTREEAEAIIAAGRARRALEGGA